MIKIEKIQVHGWEPAIRGMRNPMNSWEKSDTQFYDEEDVWSINGYEKESDRPLFSGVQIGPADHELMMKLAKNGSVHAKYRRMITVYMDITAPLYWWKEFDTYKVGTVANSCSTMHKIHEKEFVPDDFSHETFSLAIDDVFHLILEELNNLRELYLETKDKSFWYQMIQLLPSSYNQKRTVMLNYEVLANIYESRKHHKLDEWRDFCSVIENFPYSELITLKGPCETCVFYPPSSGDGKPCSQCNPDDPYTNCHEEKSDE